MLLGFRNEWATFSKHNPIPHTLLGLGLNCLANLACCQTLQAPAYAVLSRECHVVFVCVPMVHFDTQVAGFDDVVYCRRWWWRWLSASILPRRCGWWPLRSVSSPSLRVNVQQEGNAGVCSVLSCYDWNVGHASAKHRDADLQIDAQC